MHLQPAERGDAAVATVAVFVAVVEHHLEQRGAGAVASGQQRVHDVLERDVLMLVGVQRDLTDPGDEFGERRVAGQVGPQHEGVEEEPDHALGLRAAAVGDRGPGHHVVAVGVAAQQDRERAEERDEHRGAGAQGQLPQARRRRFGHLEADDPAVRRPHGRAGPVGGQLQHRRPGQPLAPVGQSRRGRLAVHPVALPEREIGVLGGRRFQRGRLAAPEGAVEGGELAVEDPDRPLVRDDVVQAQAEHVVTGA
ncbi:hypothetical protein GCM10009527_027520 [Actinomadura nitritigenes]